MKDHNNTKLLSSMMTKIRRMDTARAKTQVKIWEEMLNQVPELTDAWWELKYIVGTAKFINVIKSNLIGNCGPEDAPLIVQMLKNMCHAYNAKTGIGYDWMVDTVYGMDEYGVSRREALRILGCALRIGILRESDEIRFYEVDPFFVPSMLDVGEITPEILNTLSEAYSYTLSECGVKQELLNKHYVDMEADSFHNQMNLHLKQRHAD